MDKKIVEREAIIKFHKNGLQKREILKRLNIERSKINKLKLIIDSNYEVQSLKINKYK